VLAIVIPIATHSGPNEVSKINSPDGLITVANLNFTVTNLNFILTNNLNFVLTNNLNFVLTNLPFNKLN
jgi:hypothetical protein